MTVNNQMGYVKGLKYAQRSGRAARRQGKPIGANPYARAEFREAWWRGFNEDDETNQIVKKRNRTAGATLPWPP